MSYLRKWTRRFAHFTFHLRWGIIEKIEINADINVSDIIYDYMRYFIDILILYNIIYI